MKDPSPGYGNYSIFDVAMGLRAILLLGKAVAKPEGTSNMNGAEPLSVNEGVLQDLLEREYGISVMRHHVQLPGLNYTQINQDIAVITADYWNLQC